MYEDGTWKPLNEVREFTEEFKDKFVEFIVIEEDLKYNITIDVINLTAANVCFDSSVNGNIPFEVYKRNCTMSLPHICTNDTIYNVQILMTGTRKCVNITVPAFMGYFGTYLKFGSGTQVKYMVGASADDSEVTSGSNDYTASFCAWGNYGGTHYQYWMRWAVSVPDGSTIDAAVISHYNAAGSQSTEFTSWYSATAEDNCVDYTSNPYSRTMGAEYASEVRGTDYERDLNTTDMANVIQEWIDRDGYSEGNYLCIKFNDTDATTDEWRQGVGWDYDSSTTYTGWIYIDYTEGAADEEAPTYTDNQTNRTDGGWTEFSALWADNVGFDSGGGYIFSWHNATNWTYINTSVDKEDGTAGIVAEQVPGGTTSKTESLYPFYHADTKLDNTQLTQEEVNDLEDNDGSGTAVGKIKTLYAHMDDPTETPTAINDADCWLNYDAASTVSGGQEWRVYDLNGGNLLCTGTILNGPQTNADNYCNDLDTQGLAYSEIETMYLWVVGETHAGPGDITVDMLNCTVDYDYTEQVGESDANKTGKDYTNTFDDTRFGEITEINISLYVSNYDASGGGTAADLWLELYDGSEWVNISAFGLSGTGYKSVLTTESSVLSGWLADTENRDVRIRGIHFDYTDGSNRDEINWTGLWVNITGTKEFYNDSWVAMPASNYTNITKYVNETIGETIKWWIYVNDSANNWNATYNVYTITSAGPPDTTFTVSLPTGTLEVVFNFTNATHINCQPDNQTSGQEFFLITHDGSGTNMDYNLTLNQSAPSNVDLRADTDNDPAGALDVADTVKICSNIAPSGTCSIWLWSTISQQAPGTYERYLNVSGSQS